MTVAIVLFVVGMMLSAFFSGSETGFYRLNRARLLINALDGDWISRGLLWAANNPSVFVATALVGNNVANYVVSASIVMIADAGFSGWARADMVLPLLLTPVIFIYGELVPKNVFLAAPNRMLRHCGIPFGMAGLLFAPVSFILWLFNKLLETVGRKSPEPWQMVLARRELGELLDEGQAVGLLKPTQQAIAQATISLGAQSIAGFVEPASRFPRITEDTPPDEVVTIARRTGQTLLPVEDTHRGKRIAGSYVRVSDCILAQGPQLPTRVMPEVKERMPYLSTLSHMLAVDAPIARVVNRKQQTVGYVTLARLQLALLAE
ncbi:CNNM domain-containing protein [Aeoliella sp. ICT_H6.2]|uniref:CNNM domain-containing protein n=1 Tax=Aeoliella straminimaris TaxID=2954799 RepID=A0A9X2JIT3_9BACT|nr:CNNM domain-containing protein [Aeoliella straminimaris]MCO6046857.1 CNNM domain-containing protein [Aeoliella straminimaris]